jgi:hypothetical protein
MTTAWRELVGSHRQALWLCRRESSCPTDYGGKHLLLLLHEVNSPLSHPWRTAFDDLVAVDFSISEGRQRPGRMLRVNLPFLNQLQGEASDVGILKLKFLEAEHLFQ